MTKDIKIEKVYQLVKPHLPSNYFTTDNNGNININHKYVVSLGLNKDNNNEVIIISYNINGGYKCTSLEYDDIAHEIKMLDEF